MGSQIPPAERIEMAWRRAGLQLPEIKPAPRPPAPGARTGPDRGRGGAAPAAVQRPRSRSMDDIAQFAGDKAAEQLGYDPFKAPAS